MEADDTLRMLDDAAAAFAKPDARRTRTTRDEQQGWDPAVWHEMASMGWLAATLPERQGGLGLGLHPAARIARRLGYAGQHAPYVAAGVMAVECLAGCGFDTARLVREVTDGRQVAGIAWQPEDGRLEPHSVAVSARQQGALTLLTGVCRFVAVPHADWFIVPAMAAGRLALYTVPRTQHGVVVETEAAADGSRLGQLSFDAVALDRGALLAAGDTAAAAMERALAAGVLATSAELLGVMERSLELTLDYMKTRQQFGQPIGAFQALQHRAADMWMQQQLTQAALRSALKAFDNPASGARERQAAASSAKARASQAALYVCGQAVQLHGAIGFTDECELGVYVNRALTLAARYGNAAWHRRRFGQLVAPTQ